MAIVKSSMPLGEKAVFASEPRKQAAVPATDFRFTTPAAPGVPWDRVQGRTRPVADEDAFGSLIEIRPAGSVGSP